MPRHPRPSVFLHLLFASTLIGSLQLCSTSFAEETSTDSTSWITLFDGSSLDAWREYNHDEVTTGWRVEDGALTCISRKEQGDKARGEDLITREKFSAFELELEFKVTPKANSGVMFHVVETDKPPYYTGPEIQIQDHVGGHDGQKSGWLYQLYPSEVDSIKPVGEWNHLRVMITPEKCQIELNGVLYSEFVKGSDDWDARVAKSKFGKWKGFGEADNGHICLQDHNDEVSYRNIRVRRL
ncbi:3-keto-disaccharide hydrolase [Rhodopirellula sallentina]|uniref:Secreted protein containing DUF1080 n=1 Tax=Rhodopirellula sallentina SM41 TaxID=1263870 RepID=M5TZB3_9BACT|nr:secreted protein containing DUF1080 [Rhodopirellula sallentina SM41]